METVVESTQNELMPTDLRPTEARFHCSTCHHPVARWKVVRTGAPICAQCFFKTTEWLRLNVERYDSVIQAISLRRRQSLPRTADGHLVNAKDADDVLGAIVLHDLFQRITTRCP